MTYRNILYEVRGNVAWVTLDRPAQLNALDGTTARELASMAGECDADPLVRAVVVTGAGNRAFCSGGDVHGFAADPDSVGDLVVEMTGHLHAAISRLARLRAPVIAAVNGTVAGGGLGLFAAADLAIAADTARFSSAYTQIALTPDASSTYFLARTIGRRRAMELFLMNRVLTAAEALDWGLVNQVVPAARLLEHVGTLATSLAQGPTLAHRNIKRLMLDSLDRSLEDQMAMESESILETARSADGLAGVRAFVDKSKPVFAGR